jgi:CHASE3 domain sensor protein
MKGIRKRVTIGFLSIVVLLFFSGLVSLYELNHMSGDIEAILDSNRRSIQLTENMLDAISAHDRAVVNYAVFRDTLYADSCSMSFLALSAHISQAREEASQSAVMMFDSLQMSAERLRAVVQEL